MGYSGWGVPWISTRACTSKSFKFTAATHLAARRTIPAVYATNLTPAHVARARARELALGAGGGGATIVLEDLGADAPATVTRAEFGMCAGHGVRSPTSNKVQEAGPSHDLGRGVRPLRSLRGAGRLLGVFGHAVATPFKHF